MLNEINSFWSYIYSIMIKENTLEILKYFLKNQCHVFKFKIKPLLN
jgi:hypothetical protein